MRFWTWSAKGRPCAHLSTVSFHNFKSQDFKLSVSNPKNKYVAYVSVLSRISNCQGLGRKNKHEILKPDLWYYVYVVITVCNYKLYYKHDMVKLIRRSAFALHTRQSSQKPLVLHRSAPSYSACHVFTRLDMIRHDLTWLDVTWGDSRFRSAQVSKGIWRQGKLLKRRNSLQKRSPVVICTYLCSSDSRRLGRPVSKCDLLLGSQLPDPMAFVYAN